MCVYVYVAVCQCIGCEVVGGNNSLSNSILSTVEIYLFFVENMFYLLKKKKTEKDLRTST